MAKADLSRIRELLGKVKEKAEEGRTMIEIAGLLEDLGAAGTLDQELNTSVEKHKAVLEAVKSERMGEEFLISSLRAEKDALQAEVKLLMEEKFSAAADLKKAREEGENELSKVKEKLKNFKRQFKNLLETEEG